MTPKAIAGFWGKAIPNPETGCLEWAYELRRNYPCYYVPWDLVDGKNRHTRAHRLAYGLAYGPFDPDLHVLHSCDNPKCISPNHLFLGDNTANIQDSVSKGRRWTKLSDDDVRAIRASGESQRALGRHYGVDPSTIRKIKQRKRRVYVPD